jgi:hypothetical protein
MCIVHQLGSFDHASKSPHTNVVFCVAHIAHHLGENIRVVAYILLYVREVRAANTNIIIKGFWVVRMLLELVT